MSHQPKNGFMMVLYPGQIENVIWILLCFFPREKPENPAEKNLCNKTRTRKKEPEFHCEVSTRTTVPCLLPTYHPCLLVLLGIKMQVKCLQLQ